MHETTLMVEAHVPRVLAQLAVQFMTCRDNSVKRRIRCGEMVNIADVCPNVALREACRGGHAQLVKQLIAQGATDWESGLQGACRGGYGALVHQFIVRGASNWNAAMLEACRGGHAPIVELMVSRGATRWSCGLSAACRGGHQQVALTMITKGGNDWNSAYMAAVRGKHRSMLDLLRPRLKSEFEYHGSCELRLDCMWCARNHCEILRKSKCQGILSLPFCNAAYCVLHRT
jgi:hypothetical protein